MRITLREGLPDYAVAYDTALMATKTDKRAVTRQRFFTHPRTWSRKRWWISGIIVQNANAYSEGISKPLEAIMTVGLPFRSNWTQSCVIHDVHDPQSAVQPMAASH